MEALEKETIDRISEYRRIIAFRNVLIHGYDSLSHDVVWDIIQLPASSSTS
jgi:uncharacterized protein with HEPN domain